MFEIKYEDLKDAYKIEKKNRHLFNYMLLNHVYDPSNLFHNLKKEELIREYKELYKKHLKLLEDL